MKPLLALTVLTGATGLLCSLFVAGPLICLLLMDKASTQYRLYWRLAVGAFGAICSLITACILSWPLYSQTIHRPVNPGGPSGDIVYGILFWILIWTVAIPSFPALVVLGLVPPKLHKRRYLVSVGIVCYAIFLMILAIAKYRVYMADYWRERTRPQQTPFEHFEYLRNK
jgi:hypothetical protein